LKLVAEIVPKVGQQRLAHRFQLKSAKEKADIESRSCGLLPAEYRLISSFVSDNRLTTTNTDMTKEGDMGAITPNERRTVTRHAGNTIDPVRLRLDEGEPVPATVQDISIAGVGLVTRQHLDPGTWLVLETAKQLRISMPEIRAEVRHTRKWQEEEYLVGCCFDRYLTADDLMALG